MTYYNEGIIDLEREYMQVLHNRLYELPFIARGVFKNLPPHIEVELSEIIHTIWAERNPEAASKYADMTAQAGQIPNLRKAINEIFADAQSPVNLFINQRGQLRDKVDDAIYCKVTREGIE